MIYSFPTHFCVYISNLTITNIYELNLSICQRKGYNEYCIIM